MEKGAGSTPTGYQLEGGLTPGSVLGSVRTASAATTFTLTAPSGVFFVRLHGLLSNLRSAASNEIQLVVNAPLPPSPQLNVTGAQTGSLPLGLSDTVSFNGVPGGTYTFPLTASNVAGVSPAVRVV